MYIESYTQVKLIEFCRESYHYKSLTKISFLHKVVSNKQTENIKNDLKYLHLLATSLFEY